MPMKYVCDDCGKETDGVGAQFTIKYGKVVGLSCAKCCFGGKKGVLACNKCGAAWLSDRLHDKCKVCGHTADAIVL